MILLRLCTLIGIVVLLGSTYLSFRWMVGDFYGDRVAHTIARWQSAEAPPSAKSIETHLEFANRSLEWAPANPRYKELKALVFLFQAQSMAREDPELLILIEEMIQLHRAAAIDRPRWAISWANLAWTKSFIREYDQEFHAAIRNAVTFGPYEVFALDRVVRSAVPIWENLEAEEKAPVTEAIANGVLMSPGFARNVRSVLEDNNLLQKVCDSVSFHTDASKVSVCR